MPSSGNRNVSAADPAAPILAAEAKTLFAPLAHTPALVVAVSGGPDSTALLVLAARWRAALGDGPELVTVTVDHGLRPESAAEARAVKRLAREFGVTHRTVRWEGQKPATGLQQAAREARYALLAAAAKAARARHILTGHTLDDQAETVLIRMMRGSGLTGLGAMAKVTPLDWIAPSPAADDVLLVRPLLGVAKARLLATLARERISFADDPSNRDPRFTRARVRNLMPGLAREGLDVQRLALLARRLQRAEAAIEMAVAVAAAALSEDSWPERGPVRFDAEKFRRLPAEVALRLLGHAIAHTGYEGPVDLGKLEALCEAMARETASAAKGSLRRTLAGSMVSLAQGQLVVERAPPRRAKRPPAGQTGKPRF
jgi:tRNA(Ile)-lysidine synthase